MNPALCSSRGIATKGKEGGDRAMAYLIFAGNFRI